MTTETGTEWKATIIWTAVPATSTAPITYLRPTPVSYTHLDVYKRQMISVSVELINNVVLTVINCVQKSYLDCHNYVKKS